MKKLVLVLMAMIVVVGLFVATSMTQAGEIKRVRTLETSTQEGDEAAWDAWREDLRIALESDEQYGPAEAAVETDEGEDEDERARLVAIRDVIYGKIARVVYENHFGAWEGTDGEFDELLAGKVGPIQECAKVALETCGKGKVCSVGVASESCKFVCQDATGACPSASPVVP